MLKMNILARRRESKNSKTSWPTSPPLKLHVTQCEALDARIWLRLLIHRRFRTDHHGLAGVSALPASNDVLSVDICARDHRLCDPAVSPGMVWLHVSATPCAAASASSTYTTYQCSAYSTSCTWCCFKTIPAPMLALQLLRHLTTLVDRTGFVAINLLLAEFFLSLAVYRHGGGWG